MMIRNLTSQEKSVNDDIVMEFSFKICFFFYDEMSKKNCNKKIYRKLNVILSHFIIEFSYSNTESEYCHNENERNQSQIRDKVHLTKLKQKSSSS